MWYKNDELQTDLTESTVSADLTEVGEVWTVAVVASDGVLTSAESRRSVTIRNSTPTVTASLQWIDGAGNVMEDLDAPGEDAMLSDFGGYAQVVAEGLISTKWTNLPIVMLGLSMVLTPITMKISGSRFDGSWSILGGYRYG